MRAARPAQRLQHVQLSLAIAVGGARKKLSHTADGDAVNCDRGAARLA